jgi:GntR family transcriptional regulator
MRFFIDRDSGTPIYIQLKRQLLRAVATGVLKAGDKVPTVRQIAVDTKVDPNTVNRAFSELEREGVVQTQQGRGTFVRDRPALNTAEARRQLSQIAQRALDEARSSGYSADDLIDALHISAKRK